MDYEPIDISAWCGAGADILPGENPLLGQQAMRGLPFTVGAPAGDPDGSCYVSLAAGDAPVTLPVRKTAHNLIVAHRQMETEQHANGPVGVHVADYVITFYDSQTVTVPIRERYEISVVSDRQGISRFGIGYPYLAVTDREDTLMPPAKAPSNSPEGARPSPSRPCRRGTGSSRGAIPLPAASSSPSGSSPVARASSSPPSRSDT